MRALRAVWRFLGGLGGVEMAYTMGVANAALGAVDAFGVTLTTRQISAVELLVNAVLVLTFHLASRTTTPGPAK